MAKKKLKTANVTVGGACDEATTFTIQDTISVPSAQYALDEFEREEYIEYTDYEDQLRPTYYIPFHAVDHIVVTEEVVDVPSTDPYGCN